MIDTSNNNTWKNTLEWKLIKLTNKLKQALQKMEGDNKLMTESLKRYEKTNTRRIR